ncbi:MAG: RHS repeat-associated core domain-containing protein [Xanthomonadales bacterium]
MNSFRGLKTLTIAVSTVFLFHTLVATEFWIESVAARYYCGSFRTPQPDPDAVVWLPWRTYCGAVQTMPSSPNYWNIDDFPDQDIPFQDCAEAGSEEWQVRQEMATGCVIERTSEFRSVNTYSIPIACNGDVLDDYYISAFIEGYEADYVIICPGYPPLNLGNSITGSKYFVREPIGPYEIIEEKNHGLPQCGLSAGNPINIATGNKYHRQQDASLPGGLELVRHYNSKDENLHSFGMGWRKSYSRKINHTFSGDSSNASVAVTRDDGSVNYWRVENSLPKPPLDAKGRLDVAYTNGQIDRFTYRENDSTETYDFDGNLLSIDNDLGEYLQFSYTNSQLSAVTTASGRSLNYSYSVDGLVYQISSNDGSTWSYTYDQNDNLTQVENPDGSVKTYHYEDTNFPHALTGETDEKGNRIRSWAYDATGRAVLSTYGDLQSSTERTTITYNPDDTTTTSGPFQNSVDHSFENTHGIAKFDTVSGPCGACGNSTKSTTYDERGNKDIVADFEGNTTDYDYTADNLIQKITYAVGTPEQYEIHYNWDVFLRKPTQTVRGEKTTNYTYNPRGQILTQMETDTVTLRTRVWVYTYFEAPIIEPLMGKLKSVDGPRTDVMDVTNYEYYTFDHAGGDYLAGDLKAVINPLGHRTDYLKYDGNGRLLEMSDANGVITSITYHARGWKNSTTTDGKTTSFTYDKAGNLTRVTQADGSYINFQYDAVHRLTAIADNFNNRVEYTLDAAGNRSSEKTYDDSDVLRRQLSRGFDSLNRLVKLIDGNNDQTRYGYDNNGNRTSRVDANLNSTSFEYDALDRLAKTIDSILGEAVMNYDDSDNLISVTDPLGNVTQYGYDGLDNQTQLDSPDTGTESYEYDAAGNRTAATDGRGIRSEYFYDTLNRLTDISYPDSTLDVSFTYDVGTNGKGRLSSMTDAVGTVDYTYDARGNLSSESRSIGLHQYITSYAYNAADRLHKITYPSGMVVDYALDAAGRITAVDKTVNTVSETLVSNVRYEPFGPVTSFTYGNGLAYSATFDQDYQLAQLQSGPGLDWLLGYDPVGNILTIADQSNGSDNQTFTYDDLYRLETAQGDYDESFEYDANGNRTRYLSGIVDDHYTYKPQSNRLTTQNGWTFTRDAAGNRSEKIDAGGYGLLYTYADHNRLSRISMRDASGDALIMGYQYDGRGRRVSKINGGGEVHYIYGPSGELLGEYSAIPDGEFKDYVYLNGQPVAVITRSTETVIPPGAALIVDNGEPGTSSTGSWRTKTSTKDYGTDYLLAGKAADRSYRWTATPPGVNYQVYAWWVDKKNQSANVNYTIRYGKGETDTVTKSHKTGGGQWQLLGSYYSTDGQDYVEVSSGNKKFTADAIRWVQLNEPIKTLTEMTNFIHFDHLGTPRRVTDDHQTVVWRWASTPFGDSAPDQDPDGDSDNFTLNLRFPGQYYDAESGLHYNYFRYYDPEIGRYIESDPIGLRGGINTYGYVLENPMKDVDPLGLRVGFTLPPNLPGLNGLVKNGIRQLCSKRAQIAINDALEQLERRRSSGEGSNNCPAEKDCFKFCVSAKYLSPGVLCIFGSWITFNKQSPCGRTQDVQRTDHGIFTEFCVEGSVASSQGI